MMKESRVKKRPIGICANIDQFVDDNGDPVKPDQPDEQPKIPGFEDEDLVEIPLWAFILAVAAGFAVLLFAGCSVAYFTLSVFSALSGIPLNFAGVFLGGLIFAAVTFFQGMQRVAKYTV
jgi:hypothetical protein